MITKHSCSTFSLALQDTAYDRFESHCALTAKMLSEDTNSYDFLSQCDREHCKALGDDSSVEFLTHATSYDYNNDSLQSPLLLNLQCGAVVASVLYLAFYETRALPKSLYQRDCC